MNNIDYQKGISLLVTFFVMSIILSVVLGLSIILLSEIRVMRNMGYSVISFYASDTGIEKSLYYDRKQIPEGKDRGICYICTSCTDCSACSTLDRDLNGCSNCNDCLINYSTDLDNKSFQETIIVSEDLGDTFQSYGIYKNIKRAIELSTGSGSVPIDSDGPQILTASATPNSVPEGTTVNIYITVQSTVEIDSNRVIAYIEHPYDEDPYESIILGGGSGTYLGEWTGPEGIYYVDIEVCDIDGNCDYENNI